MILIRIFLVGAACVWREVKTFEFHSAGETNVFGSRSTGQEMGWVATQDVGGERGAGGGTIEQRA